MGENIGTKAVVTEMELNDLRQKFQLLEGDRKAYYEISMKNMKQNKHEISELRANVKAMRQQLKKVRKQNAQVRICEPNEVDKLEKHVNVLRRNLDTVKAKVDGKRAELEKLRDKATELEMEAEGKARGIELQKNNATDPGHAKRIRTLENRLDRSIIKYNEAQSIRTTYEQIVQRLKEERDGFDSQLAAMEKTIAVKDRDMEELKTLSGDAQQAKDVTMRDLQRARENLDKDRKERERELKRKRQIADSTANILQSVQTMDKSRRSILGKYHGDMSKDEEDRLRRQQVVTMLQVQVQQIPELDMEKLDQYEIAFTKLMKISGVSDVNEIIHKIVGQEETRENLRELSRENVKRIDQTVEEMNQLRDIVEQIRFTGIPRGGVTNRKKVDELEDTYNGAKQVLESKRLKFDKATELIVNAQAGIRHLMDRLKPYRQEDIKSFALNNDTLPMAINQCEDILSNMLKKINDENNSNAMTEWKEDDGVYQADEADILAVMPFNQRVRLRDVDTGFSGADFEKVLRIKDSSDPTGADDASLLSYDSEEDEGYGNNDGNDPITRENIKQASKIIMKHRSPRGSSVSPSGKRNSIANDSVARKKSVNGGTTKSFRMKSPSRKK